MTRRAIQCLLPVVLVLALAALPDALAVAKAKPKSVGVVVTVGGSMKLSARGSRLSKGAKLTLGERLVMGKGLRATLRLTKPKGVGNRDLVDLSPVKGAKLDIKVSRKGSRVIVMISPAAK
jgi:hypothetical protein